MLFNKLKVSKLKRLLDLSSPVLELLGEAMGFYTDFYDIYLSGASPLIEIINLESDKNKEIIIFRDSYGSSLAPLLLYEYSKITLVDTRYMRSSLLEEYMDFEGQDVLFLYSVMVVNNSQMLK